MMGHMEWTFTGEVIEWRGPAPYLFVAMTPEDSEELKEAASGLTYWGQVPVHVTIGGTGFTTALFPRDGRYLVPVKAAVQRAEAIGEGAIVEVALRLNAARRRLRPSDGGRAGPRGARPPAPRPARANGAGGRAATWWSWRRRLGRARRSRGG
jgi:hypothetical protein